MSTSAPTPQPEPPFPEQHLDKPGLEADLRPRPRYRAPRYRGADKLLDQVALISGGDSGIGRAVALLFAREGADVAIVHVARTVGKLGKLDILVNNAAVQSHVARIEDLSTGPVWTPLNPADRDAEEVAHFGEDTPMKRPAPPEEIAPAFVYFASNIDSSFVTGEVLTLLGGLTTAA